MIVRVVSGCVFSVCYIFPSFCPSSSSIFMNTKKIKIIIKYMLRKITMPIKTKNQKIIARIFYYINIYILGQNRNGFHNNTRISKTTENTTLIRIVMKVNTHCSKRRDMNLQCPIELTEEWVDKPRNDKNSHEYGIRLLE
jgi:hypothetical protein